MTNKDTPFVSIGKRARASVVIQPNQSIKCLLTAPMKMSSKPFKERSVAAQQLTGRQTGQIGQFDRIGTAMELGLDANRPEKAVSESGSAVGENLDKGIVGQEFVFR